MRNKKNASRWVLIGAIGFGLSACTVAVVEQEPKGTCLYHAEGKATCAEKVTESDCRSRYGTWSTATKDCPD
jgi:hypothetical protein